MLAELASLPTAKTAQDKAARNLLFASMDGNGNGYLSLAEIDGGMKSMLPGNAARAKPAVMRAFQAAKVARPSGSQPNASLRDDVVERGAEFRLFLLYLKRYLELLAAFERLDADGDRRLDVDEFTEACRIGLLSTWGVNVDDAEEEFRKMDLDGGGKVLFDEFAHWALCRHLRLEGSEKEDEEELPMPAQPNLAATGAAKAAAAAAAAVKAAEKPPSYITKAAATR